jgi:NADH-quinone oxidoreductase subunit N
MAAFSYIEMIHTLAPQIALLFGVLLVLALDLGPLRGKSDEARWRASVLAALLSILAAAWLASSLALPASAAGLYRLTLLSMLINHVLLLLSAILLLLSVSVTPTRHISEYVSMILLATVGMTLLTGATDLLVLFLALELLSLCLYVLTGMDKQRAASSEAALKYFLFGAMSAAMLLFGFSYLYGIAGSTQLAVIGRAVSLAPQDPLVLMAIVLVLAGLGFKVAAAPFHFWAPDAYQGAPLSAAAATASSSKVASFTILLQLLLVGFGAAAGDGSFHFTRPGWLPVVTILAAASILIGNLAALAQRNVRRLLAYSAVAHTGYALVALQSTGPEAVSALLYYVLTYSLATLGAFAVLTVLQQQGYGDSYTDFAGFSRRSPIAALCLLVFLLSLAGIPPLAGFTGKFLVFAAALRAREIHYGAAVLVGMALAASAISFYYYLQVLKFAFVVEQPAQNRELPRETGNYLPLFVSVLLAVLVILLGCFPSGLLDALRGAILASG